MTTNQKTDRTQSILTGIVFGVLCVSVMFAGCTSRASEQPGKPTPSPSSIGTETTVIAFTAASLRGATPKLAEGFEQMYPGRHVIFNLDGTQALMTQVQNGARADVFISASVGYTNELRNGGYFADDSIKSLASNYVVVILPANNPAAIGSLADLAKPGVKIARADKSVPVGTATCVVLANLANSTFGQDWNLSAYRNTRTLETSEPAVAVKVALGEVDAGFAYESTATAAPDGTYLVIPIPEKDNYLQTYTIGVMKESLNKGAASDFETFMLSTTGRQILEDYGFRPAWDHTPLGSSPGTTPLKTA